MGLGDDLLVTSFAESEKMKYPDKQIVIGNFKEKKIYEELWTLGGANRFEDRVPVPWHNSEWVASETVALVDLHSQLSRQKLWQAAATPVLDRAMSQW